MKSCGFVKWSRCFGDASHFIITRDLIMGSAITIAAMLVRNA